jgi:hypothetical protein
MSIDTQKYRQRLRCNVARIDDIFADCFAHAREVLSEQGIAAWLDGASEVCALGRGQELVLIFLEQMPRVAALAGEEIILEAADTAAMLSSTGNPRAIAPFLATLPAAAQRLHGAELLRDYMRLVWRMAKDGKEGIVPLLTHVESLLAQLSIGGLRNWVEYGLRAYRHQHHRMGDYFSLQSADSRAALTRERHGALFADHERRLNLYLHAFWQLDTDLHAYSLAFDTRRRPMPHLDRKGLHLPDVHDDQGGVRGIDRYRALLAHMAAHQRWTTPFIADNYNLFQHLFIEAFEDARVEWLAARELPGLRRLWLALHPIPKEGECGKEYSCIRHKMSMLSRALLDPAHPYTDPLLNEYVARFHARMARDPCDTAIATDLGVEYLSAVHQASFRLPKVWFKDTEVSYRDDNRYMWLFLEDTTDEDDFHSDHAAANPREEEQIGERLSRYQPEWDYQENQYRPDWVTVYETVQPEGDPHLIDALLTKHSQTARRLKRVVDLLKPQQHMRVRFQEDGSELDLDIAIRAMADLRSGTTPDPRIHMSYQHDGRDISVLLLLDLSESINETATGASLHRGPRLDPIGETATGASLHRGPRLDPINETATGASLHRGPRLDPIGETPPGAPSTVLALSQEAVALLGWVCAELGDPFAIAGFASNTRHEVRYVHFKGFGEPWGAEAKARLAGMQGGLSTRMGAALRHAGHYLSRRGSGKKLLLLLTDGEPSDIDVDDPEYLRADAHKAVEELAARGVTTFCLTLDPNADEYVARIFGPGRYMVVDHVNRLPERLPLLYAALTK